MTEEPKQSYEEEKRQWKAEQIAEYAKLEANKKAVEKRWEENTELKKLQTELRKLLDKVEETEKPYHTTLTHYAQQQAGIKQQLVDRWFDTEDKTFECDAGTATLRINRSLCIRSKEKLVAFLELNKKLTEFISGFETTKLRKIKDAGMLEDEIATWDEKKSVAIKIAGVEQ